MIKLNRILYFLINVYWGVLIGGAFLFSFKFDTGIDFLFTQVLALFLAALQLYGAYHLIKKSNYLVPLIAISIFLIEFDLEGFKFATTTFAYLKTQILSGGSLSIDFQLVDDAYLLTNFSFKKISFEMVGINLLTIVQLALLFKERKSAINSNPENTEQVFQLGLEQSSDLY